MTLVNLKNNNMEQFFFGSCSTDAKMMLKSARHPAFWTGSRLARIIPLMMADYPPTKVLQEKIAVVIPSSKIY